MFSHTQLEEVARLRHAELLAQAARAQKLGLHRRKRNFHLSALFQWLGLQGRKWQAPRRPVTVEGIVASRQQAC